MTESIYLIGGVILLLMVIYDFFYTTLSGSGAGFITKLFAALTHKFNQLLGRIFGREFFNYSGLLVNLTILAVWVFMAWVGLYLVYSSNPEAIVSSEGKVANNWERLYQTGYTLSTLGVGDFKPTTPFFQILTSFFSFFGFIFFTSSMTYLISVASALVHKRTLIRFIKNLGETPHDIADSLKMLNTSYRHLQILSLQEMVDKLFVNHKAYPVLHYFNNSDVEGAVSVNICRLDEAVTIFLTSDDEEHSQKEIYLLRNSLTNFFNLINNSYSQTHPKKVGSAAALKLSYQKSRLKNLKLEDRRKIMKGFLKSENLSWENLNSKT